MKREIPMPRMSPEMKSGVLCAWLKEEGDAVVKGEPLFEIEAEKVVSQVAAEFDGVLTRQIAEEGDEIAAECAVAEMETDA